MPKHRPPLPELQIVRPPPPGTTEIRGSEVVGIICGPLRARRGRWIRCEPIDDELSAARQYVIGLAAPAPAPASSDGGGSSETIKYGFVRTPWPWTLGRPSLSSLLPGAMITESLAPQVTL